jgi:ATP-dependent protease HslVU (ClpYQ) peptidase subunit
MTCIVGLIDNGITYMGGDSRSTCNGMKSHIEQRKVFKVSGTSAIMGFSGSVRDMNLLTYAENLIDKRDEPNIDEKYIVTKFVPNLIQLFSINHRNETDKGVSSFNSYMLLAYKNKIWMIEGNYAILSIVNNYQAIGSGTCEALGSLYTTEKTNINCIERIHLALQAASKFCTSVGAPYYIINTDNDKVIEFKE